MLASPARSALPVRRASGRARACASAAFIVFLALAFWLSLTRDSWWDEGLFADVALTFRNAGHLCSSVLAPHTFGDMPAVGRYTYWQFPMYLLSLGTWFHLAPPTVQSMRLFSLLWGCLFDACWFLFVRALSRDETLALCLASIVALDYSSILAASDGRMDMMCAALGQAALAAYVCLRESHLKWAVFLAGLFAAASLFSHGRRNQCLRSPAAARSAPSALG